MILFSRLRPSAASSASSFSSPQPAPRKTRLASDKYHARNKGDEMKSSRPQARYTVGPVLLGFFLFVVVGSCECALCPRARPCSTRSASLSPQRSAS